MELFESDALTTTSEMRNGAFVSSATKRICCKPLFKNCCPFQQTLIMSGPTPFICISRLPVDWITWERVMIITVIISQDIVHLFTIFSYQESLWFMSISMLLCDNRRWVYFNQDACDIEFCFCGFLMITMTAINYLNFAKSNKKYL